MPVVVSRKYRYSGTVTLSALDAETTIVELGPSADDWMVEGYVDLSNLQSGDMVTVNEYVALDGANYRLLYSATVAGPAQQPVLRLHTKTLLATRARARRGGGDGAAVRQAGARGHGGVQSGLLHAREPQGVVAPPR